MNKGFCVGMWGNIEKPEAWVSKCFDPRHSGMTESNRRRLMSPEFSKSCSPLNWILVTLLKLHQVYADIKLQTLNRNKKCPQIGQQEILSLQLLSSTNVNSNTNFPFQMNLFIASKKIF